MAGPGKSDPGAATIEQDVRVYAAELAGGESVSHGLAAGRHGWAQVVRGGIVLNGHELDAGDGAALTGEPALSITGGPEGGEVLVFDLS